MIVNVNAIGIDYTAILPELVVVVTAVVVLVLELFLPPGRRRLLVLVTLIGLALALVANAPLWGHTRFAFADTVVGDSFSAFFNVVLVATSIFTVIISPRYLRAVSLDHGEYYVLLLAATSGMMLLAAATSLMTIFLGIELLSLSLYVLSGFARTQPKSQESALKYLLLGGFATGFLLYGMALMYAATGTTTLRGLAAFTALSPAAAGNNPLLLLGIGFLSVGLAFKASAAPFHMWTPDVYEGAPTIVTTFMSVATKAAAFAAVGRIFVAVFPNLEYRWYVPIALIAVFSLFIGNLVAITQDNLKRMLAYSGIAHAGFILLGILPGTRDGLAATLFYIAAYAVMNFGAFAVVTCLGARGEQTADINYWRGLFYRRPFLATTMTIFMLSLAGIPPTFGFFAKLFVFRTLVVAQLWPPLIVAIVMTVVSFYYYLRVVVVMLAVPEGERPEPERVGAPMGTVLAISAAGTMGLGIFSGLIFDWASTAAGVQL